MKHIILILLFAFQGIVLSSSESEKKELDELSHQIKNLIFSKENPSELDFKQISANLSILSSPNRFISQERYSIYSRFQEDVIQIPGYAEAFRDQLINLYDDRLSAPTGSPKYNEATASLPIETTIIFHAIQSLPTKDTVLILADLYNYSKFDPRPIDDSHNPAESIPMLAGKILNGLPIKNRPYPKVKQGDYNDRNLPVMIEKWRLWCHDVKAGKIEPEFGPEIFADGTIIPPLAERQAARAKKLAPTILQTQEGEHKNFAWLWIAIGILAAGGLAVWKTKRKK